MYITSLVVKNFRCFTNKQIEFNGPLVIIKGPNGTGKTSIIEALHYGCYLRSFRTRTTRELLSFDRDAFSIKIGLQNDTLETNDLSIGYAPATKAVLENAAARRVVKLNNTELESYKDLVNSYRVITFTDDDVQLIKGAPETRRSFLDSALMLVEPSYRALMSKYAQVLAQRNALLRHEPVNQESYELWTESLLSLTKTIREHRQTLIKNIQMSVNDMLTTYFDAPFHVGIQYKPKEDVVLDKGPLVLPARHSFNDGGSEQRESKYTSGLLAQEIAARHSLIGAHLDDCTITCAHKTSRHYASKGQQKLIALLIKLAQPAAHNPQSCVFLLDDVLADLDNERAKRLFDLLMTYKTQFILTSPQTSPLLEEIASSHQHQIIEL